MSNLWFIWFSQDEFLLKPEFLSGITIIIKYSIFSQVFQTSTVLVCTVRVALAYLFARISWLTLWCSQKWNVSCNLILIMLIQGVLSTQKCCGVMPVIHRVINLFIICWEPTACRLARVSSYSCGSSFYWVGQCQALENPACAVVKVEKFLWSNNSGFLRVRDIDGQVEEIY